MTSNLFNRDQLIASFNRAADTYDKAIALPAEIGKRLLERLGYIKLQPQVILDLGAATGYCTRALAKRYPKADILAVDFASRMLNKAKKQAPFWRRRQHFICADARQIPLSDQSVDLIYSNLLFHWIDDLPAMLSELARILKPCGLLLFTCLGPDTLQEIRQSWFPINSYPHVHTFLDMHDLGDALLKFKFTDPVMDMEKITLSYDHPDKLFGDLKALSAQNLASSRNKGLTTPRQWKQFIYRLSPPEKNISVTFEILYGHAWTPLQTNTETANEAGEVYISVTKIKRKHT